MGKPRGPRGEGDPLRANWLDGDMRPPFCSSHNNGGGDIGCRYCWENTCLWDDNQRAKGREITSYGVAPSSPPGRHRAIARRQQPFLALLRRHRRSQEE